MKNLNFDTNEKKQTLEYGFLDDKQTIIRYGAKKGNLATLKRD
jgi:hypothetical protein